MELKKEFEEKFPLDEVNKWEFETTPKPNEIWQFIESHLKRVREEAIEECAKRCDVTREKHKERLQRKGISEKSQELYEVARDECIVLAIDIRSLKLKLEA